MLESNMTPTRMQRYRKYRCKLPFLTTLSFYTGCLFYRRDSFSKYFARILKRQENDRSLNSKKKKIQSVYVSLLITCKIIYIYIYNMQGCVMQSHEMALNKEKTLKLSGGKGKSSRLRKAYLLTKNICPDQFFLTFVKNAIQVCMCYKCLCKFSFLVIRVP